MTAATNRYGLSRTIRDSIKREIRRRSKFGCVLCRSGIYEYEHIDPEFADAREHDPDKICCLCPSCHALVTRGQRSKAMVAKAYRDIQDTPPEKVPPPTGPLDFHTGTAELLIGGLQYSPAVTTVLRYHGRNLMWVAPSYKDGEPGRITAVFADDAGREVFAIDQNEWVGSGDALDIEVRGARLVVRQKPTNRVCLALRLDPPGRIVIEQLDMRYKDAHVLANEQSYAVGRYYIDDGVENIHWAHASINVVKATPEGVAIEFAEPIKLHDRHMRSLGFQELADQGSNVVVNGRTGFIAKLTGIAIATLCDQWYFFEGSIGTRAIERMREVMRRCPERLPEFISSGKLTDHRDPIGPTMPDGVPLDTVQGWYKNIPPSPAAPLA